ncbi:MAG TPA: YggS family pyridoxal phosphate-dependent enzyme [Acidimicrobiales bacterium]|nr:YggS family pyridoxal phosphate-dependent enzyme [Acidimicrobiales bacterium]
MTALHERVARGLGDVRRRIAVAGADPSRVTVVAVTKGFGVEAVEAALTAGLVDVGESYAQELVTKSSALGRTDVRWHFVGRLQSNKVKALAGVVDRWQSVDRPSLVEELARRASGARVLVQVNVSGEPRKGGCPPAETSALVSQLVRSGLRVDGLMAVGAWGPPEQARPGFRLLSGLADALDLPERSMGMSGDLEVALEEGATMIRVGQALFGPRPTRGADPAPSRSSGMAPSRCDTK